MATTKPKPKPKFIEFPKAMEQRITIEHAVLDGFATDDLKRIAGLPPFERYIGLRDLADLIARRTEA